MFYRKITTDISTAISIPQFAEELYTLTDNNRDYLKRWLPWLDSIVKPSDTKSFIQLQLQRFIKGEALHETVFYKDKIAGVLGYNRLDQQNGIGYVGYWLAEEYCGKGIMTLAVSDLIELGFEHFPIHKIDIRCGVDNVKSRAIPERLGFRNEGQIRRAEKVYDQYYDHIIYGLFEDEYRNQT